MKHFDATGKSDLTVLTSPQEIRLASTDPDLDRNFDRPTTRDNRNRLKKMLRIFSVCGKLLPTMLPRTDPGRRAAQDALWSRLDKIAQEIKHGPIELEPLAEWVGGIGTAETIGPLVQQTVGRLFVEDFTSTEKSWAAACTILEASSSSDVLKMWWWRMSGKVARAQSLLSSMVKGDLFGVNGIGVALHHIVDGLHRMRQLAADPAVRGQMDVEAVLDECLFAPGSVVRLAEADGEAGGCPFRKGSLLVLQLGSASKGRENRDLVFLSQSWSRCPAESWVPALLEGVWRRTAFAGERQTTSTN